LYLLVLVKAVLFITSKLQVKGIVFFLNAWNDLINF